MKCREQLAQLYLQISEMDYPFDQTRKGLSVAKYLMKKDPEKHKDGDLLQICESVTDKMAALHGRLIKRIYELGNIVENAVLSGFPRKR